MKCHQCNRPALYQHEDGPALCLDCESKRVDMHTRQFLLNAALMNQAVDELDAISGFYTPGGRIPVVAIANTMRGKITLNNIAINNSIVGAVNTGDLARIDAVITLSKGTDAEDVGRLLRQLTQAVLDAKEMASDAKQEVLDLIRALGEQVIASQGKPKASVIRALLDGIEKRVSGMPGLYKFAQDLATMIGKLFGF